MNMKLNLDENVIAIKGIGSKKSERLGCAGITTVGDLLMHMPVRYKNKQRAVNIMRAYIGEEQLVEGRLIKVRSRYLNGRKSLTECVFCSSDAARVEFTVSFFNMPYLAKTLEIGTEYSLFGKIESRKGIRSIVNPEISPKGGSKDRRGIIPVYKKTAGITDADFIEWISYAVKNSAVSDDWLDEKLVTKNNMCTEECAYTNIHFPDNEAIYRAARWRIIYDQLLVYQIAAEKNKKLREDKELDASIEDVEIREFITGLPFELTQGQKKAISEIEADMISAKPMNRLIQGDVGCGKTVVAAASIYKTVISGKQAALMAPTSILAYQHFNSLDKMLKAFGIKVAVLTGGTGATERGKIIADLAYGKIDLLIGTHAILQEDVKFTALSLVITDEQHRFGVNQRKQLADKKTALNVLVMTATPIPRTLAATVYGDMDFSVIKGRPESRKAIITRAVSSQMRGKAYAAVLTELKKGNRAYVISPSIDADDEDLSSVEKLYAELKEKFSDYSPALLHGRLSYENKKRIMNDFAEGKINLLISTVVVEVGLDVPNATIIVIENSERFGLAQLHQLRGRVGRSSLQSYCYLINYAGGDTAEQRMRVMTETNDGFEISERDYELRGPGDIMGTMQHGILSRSILSLFAYTEIAEAASRDARSIVCENAYKINECELNRRLQKICTTNNSYVI